MSTRWRTTLQRWPNAKRQEQHLHGLGARGSRLSTVDESLEGGGFTSWLPSAAALAMSSAMAATCGGEFRVDHAGIRGGAGLATSGGHVSRVKPGSERSRVDFFYKLMEWNVGESQWAVLGCRGHDNRSIRTP
jgi:hypothetical protein